VFLKALLLTRAVAASLRQGPPTSSASIKGEQERGSTGVKGDARLGGGGRREAEGEGAGGGGARGKGGVADGGGGRGGGEEHGAAVCDAPLRKLDTLYYYTSLLHTLCTRLKQLQSTRLTPRGEGGGRGCWGEGGGGGDWEGGVEDGCLHGWLYELAPLCGGGGGGEGGGGLEGGEMLLVLTGRMWLLSEAKFRSKGVQGVDWLVQVCMYVVCVCVYIHTDTMYIVCVYCMCMHVHTYMYVYTYKYVRGV
jgi:hypothetical protein